MRQPALNPYDADELLSPLVKNNVDKGTAYPILVVAPMDSVSNGLLHFSLRPS